MFLGANTRECESSRERKFPGHVALGSESSREQEGQERKGQGAKVPWSELAWVLLADLLQEANWPGSKKAVNRIELSISPGISSSTKKRPESSIIIC